MLGGEPILKRSVDAYRRCDLIADLVVALPGELVQSPPDYLIGGTKPVLLVEGGSRRRDSVAQAFARVPAGAEVVVIHDAAP
jgi:2-C-methyl-D-erythritol 4-phosphate cytidylyltransferase